MCIYTKDAMRLEIPDSLCLGLSEVLTFLNASPLHETDLGELASKRLTSNISTLLHPLDNIAEHRSVIVICNKSESNATSYIFYLKFNT